MNKYYCCYCHDFKPTELVADGRCIKCGTPVLVTDEVIGRIIEEWIVKENNDENKRSN